VLLNFKSQRLLYDQLVFKSQRLLYDQIVFKSQRLLYDQLVFKSQRLLYDQLVFKSQRLLYDQLVFNIQKFYILHIEYLYVSYLTQIIEVFPIQHSSIGFYNRGGNCLLRGSTWVFK
jgi:hypothetical protein